MGAAVSVYDVQPVARWTRYTRTLAQWQALGVRCRRSETAARNLTASIIFHAKERGRVPH